jgi:hypothetical protein
MSGRHRLVAALALVAAGAIAAALAAWPAPAGRLSSGQRARLESAVLARVPGGALAGETCGVTACRFSVQTRDWTRCVAWSASLTPHGARVSRLGRC